jgi:fatty acid desaturase
MLLPVDRARFRAVANGRNALSLTGLWAFVIGLVWLVAWSHQWWVALAAFLVMGPIHVRFAILMHEAAHRLLFSTTKLNDVVGKWLIAYPAMVPIQIYRRGHLSHHKDEFGPDEPDVQFYAGYPGAARALRRRLVRDAVGISGAKNFFALLRANKTAAGRRIAVPILTLQLGLWALSWGATGDWWIYPLLWWLPWMTQWRVLNRLRAIGEHGGMQRSDDRRMTTHNVKQRPLARLWLVPYNTGCHLAHHVDMGIPWRHLPAYHRELERAGYVTDAITFSSYTALWRAACSDTLG